MKWNEVGVIWRNIDLSFFKIMSWWHPSMSHQLLAGKSGELANTKPQTGLHTLGSWKLRGSLASQGCCVCLFMRAKEMITCHCSFKKKNILRKKNEALNNTGCRWENWMGRLQPSLFGGGSLCWVKWGIKKLLTYFNQIAFLSVPRPCGPSQVSHPSLTDLLGAIFLRCRPTVGV